MSNEKFKVKFGLAVGDTAATIDGTTGNIVTAGDLDLRGSDITNTTGGINITTTSNNNITLDPDGTGRVQVNADIEATGNGNFNGTVIINNDQTVTNPAYQAYSGANLGSLTWNGSSWDASGGINSDGGDFGNITVGIATDNTISTTTGNLVITSATSAITVTGDTTFSGDLNVQGGDITNSTGELRITSGSTNSNIVLTPNGTGDVLLTADTVQIGDANVNANLTTNGTGNLVLNTNNGTNSGQITILNGANANITVVPNGTGDIILSADTVQFGDNSQPATITTNGTGDLVLNTNNGTNAGSITLANGVNGNITVVPNGTGSVALTLANGGNLTNTRNYVQGAIRNSTSAAAGDIWTFGPGGSGYRGISLDNSADTTKGPETLIRSFSGGAVSGSGTRGRIVFEKARGTSASPTAVQSADQLASVEVTGYTSTGWVADLVAAPTATQLFTASENWVSTTNLGTQYTLSLAPTGTTITSGANLTPVIQASPQTLSIRSDVFAIGKGKTGAFTATGSSISGTTLTIGTVTSGTVAVGQVLAGANITVFGVYIVSNISGSGSGSTWTVSQSVTAASGTITGVAGFVGSDGTTLDALATPRLLTNVIKNSGGNDVVTMTSGNTNTTVNTTLLSLINPTTYTTYGGSSNLLINAGNPAAAAFNDRISQLRIQTATTSSSEASTVTFNTAKYDTGTKNFSATASGDYLGEFFFAGNYGTGTSFTTLGPSVRFRATAAENFTATNSGGAFAINLDKIGGSTPYDAISIDSSNAVFASNALALNDNTGTGLVGSSKISYNRVYGQWQYDATITPAGANTAYAFPWQGGSAVTDYANIASATNTSRIQPNAVGFYNLQFSLQLHNTDNAADHTAYIWWRKNGTDITGSMGRVYVTKQHQTISAWNNIVQATASTDYFELMYAVDNVALIFPYVAATGFGPSTAATFLSLTPVGA